MEHSISLVVDVFSKQDAYGEFSRPRGGEGGPPEGRWERLSLRSSGERLPWAFVSQDSVEDGEEFSGHGDESDKLWLAGGDELVTKAFENVVVTARHHGGDKESTADPLSPAANEALAAPLAGLTSPLARGKRSRRQPA